ncbi:uncharacterized protein LOC100904162 [Galendromus occidentalis]|uniref:Uncharacterized protein LOC100904162 n=1 Tax=Galendromus occidentalis TaxID=34638 RepID=A0AAJ6VVB7_9ACAR|nr:uncharacterized protein LOC100904162 [Galendromus occidentalis]
MNSGRDPPINLLTISTEEFVLSRDDLIRRIQQRRFPIEYSSECQSVPKTSSLFKYSPFFSEDRFIRSRTRLERAESFTYDEIYPILLPSDEPAVKLLILNIHARECLHSGGIVGTLHNLRRRYLVLKARRLTKDVIAKCTTCRRFKAVPGQMESPCLPAFRVDHDIPWSTTAVDFAGPLAYKDENGKTRKGYLLLYTCCLIRAVHLELCLDMTTFEFLLAFRRFVNRFPTVVRMLSDNGLTFKRAAREFRIMFRHLQSPDVNSWLNSKEITWSFITEKSPWRGGVHERLIQVVKRPLRKVLRRKVPFFRELETILTDIEAMVNSRPLTPVSTTPDDIRALTPADLMFGYRATTRLPTVDLKEVRREDSNAVILLQRHVYLQNILSAYWKRFRSEYLQQLRSMHTRNPCKSTEFAPGDVCLLFDESPNRATWPLCRIMSLYGGDSTDGKKRSCVIRCANGKTYNRPIQLLYKLESAPIDEPSQRPAENASQ